MAGELGIRCECGAVRGVLRGLSRRDSNRAVCYCDDCQAYAHYLDRAGTVLDAHGGTDIVQISPAHAELTRGTDQLRCVRLTSRGLYRWYAGCCRTPLGNMLPTRHVPFIGIVHSCVEGGPDSIGLAVGPVRARVWGRFAKGDTSGLDGLHASAPLPMVLRLSGLLLKWRLRADHRRSPFFDAATGQPVAAPRVLSADELGEVIKARDGIV